MGFTSVDQSTTDAVIRLAYFRAQSETNSHSYCFVAHTESTSWDRHRMKPMATIGGCRGQESGSVVLSGLILTSDLKMWQTTTESNTLWLPTGNTSAAGDQTVIASDLMGHSCLHRLPGYFEEFVPVRCEYQQQKLNKPMMQAWTRFEPPKPLTTPEGWPVIIIISIIINGNLYSAVYKPVADDWLTLAVIKVVAVVVVGVVVAIVAAKRANRDYVWVTFAYWYHDLFGRCIDHCVSHNQRSFVTTLINRLSLH